MENFSPYEAIEQAIQTEKLGYQFYTSVAEHFRADAGLSALFRALASKEREHEERFSRLKEMMGKTDVENWEEVSSYLRAIVESEFFLSRDKALSIIEKATNVAHAINSAIGFEKETLLYFYAIRDAIGKNEILDMVIAEEKSHILWLRNFERKAVQTAQ